MVAGAHLTLSLVAEVLITFTSVQGATDLLVSLNEALQLNGQVAVLTNKHIAMVLQGINLSLSVSVLTLQGLVGESQVVLFTLGAVELLLGVSGLAF